MQECFAACQDDDEEQIRRNFEMMKKGKYQRRDTLFQINTEVGGEYNIHFLSNKSDSFDL